MKPTNADINRRLKAQLSICLDQYAERVHAGGNAEKVFIELNQRWTNVCNASKRADQLKLFSIQVTKLNQLTLGVEKRQRKARLLGRILFWFFVTITVSWIAGLSYLFYYVYITFINN